MLLLLGAVALQLVFDIHGRAGGRQPLAGQIGAGLVDAVELQDGQHTDQCRQHQDHAKGQQQLAGELEVVEELHGGKSQHGAAEQEVREALLEI